MLTKKILLKKDECLTYDWSIHYRILPASRCYWKVHNLYGLLSKVLYTICSKIVLHVYCQLLSSRIKHVRDLPQSRGSTLLVWTKYYIPSCWFNHSNSLKIKLPGTLNFDERNMYDSQHVWIWWNVITQENCDNYRDRWLAMVLILYPKMY